MGNHFRSTGMKLGSVLAIALAAVGMVAPRAVEAACMPRYLTVWPKAGSIPTNSVFLLQGHRLDQEWLGALGTCDLKLAAADDQVCLTVSAENVGERGIRQLLLQPERPLLAGLTYVLLFPSSLQGHESEALLADLDGVLRKSARTWTVDHSADHLPPQWQERALVQDTSFIHYGCGPAVYASIRTLVLEENSVLAKVTLREVGSRKLRQYLLPITDESLNVGHGMCSGAFDLKSEQPYEVQLELMDVAGNSGPELSPILEFEIEKPSGQIDIF